MATHYIAAVAVPHGYRADTDTVSSVWRNVGYYTSRKAAENACRRFIGQLEGELPPELDGFATYCVESIGRLEKKPSFIRKLVLQKPPCPTPATGAKPQKAACNRHRPDRAGGLSSW